MTSRRPPIELSMKLRTQASLPHSEPPLCDRTTLLPHSGTAWRQFRRRSGQVRALALALFTGLGAACSGYVSCDNWFPEGTYFVTTAPDPALVGALVRYSGNESEGGLVIVYERNGKRYSVEYALDPPSRE